MTGEELLLLLHRKRVKQKELGRRIGVSEPTISRYISGVVNISAERENQILEALEENMVDYAPPTTTEVMTA